MNKPAPKTILLFAYYWPPASGPGVQRWLKFAKYLPEEGFNTIVITPENGSYPNMDPSLVDEIPDSTAIVRTKTMEPFRLFNILSGKAHRGKATSVGMGDIKGSGSLIKKIAAYVRANWFIPDARKGWNRYAIRAGAHLIKENDIDLIVTTGPPHSSHLIGLKLSQQFNLPWVADFRDPWTNIYYNKFLPRTVKSRRKDQELENQVLSKANAVSVVSNGLQQELGPRANKIAVIHNGYDEEDFEKISEDAKDAYFRLSYIGNLKVNQNCRPLWEAIRELSSELPRFRDSFRLSFTGNVHEEIVATLSEFELDDLVEQLPFVEHAEAVKRMQSSDALLFLIPESPNNHQIITGKIFEYLASKTPMVSIGPPQGDAAVLIRECGRSPMISYKDKEAIKTRIRSLWEEWKQAEKPSAIKVQDNGHEIYSRKALTQKLAKLFRESLNS